MESRTAGPRTPDPDAIEFVRFCYRRRRVGWPELYDEMCAVAAKGKFRGMGPDELAGLGIGFSLFDMPALAVLSATVIAEEQAKRRPVAVAIVAEPVAIAIEGAAADGDPVEAVLAPAAAEVASAALDVAAATVVPSDERPAERSGIDVPIRLSAATASA